MGQALKQRREIGEFVLHQRVAVILLSGFGGTKKPKAREAVYWLPNQWVSAVGLNYFPARGEGW